MPAPYISFEKVFQRILDDLAAREVFPARIDRSVFRMSGDSWSQLKSTLLFFKLIDDAGQPSSLFQLLPDIDQRRELLAELMRRSYRTVFQVDLERASSGQLKDAIRALGVSGDTHRKAVAFFIEAANYCNISLSAFITTKGPKRARKPRGRKVGRSAPLDIRQTSLEQAGLQRTSRVAALPGGGVVQLVIDFDVATLDSAGFEFVAGLIRAIDAYKMEQPE